MNDKMGFTNEKAWAKEMDVLVKKRNSYLKQYKIKKEPAKNLLEKVPENLDETLKIAFVKAFEVIYEKGTDLIDKTYAKDKAKQQYKINRFAAEVKQNRTALKAFSKQSSVSGNVNLMIAGVEGIGLGLVGCGLPDIPLLTAMILRSLYEISTHYGYDYSRPEEQMYQLLIIQGAMSYGEDLKNCIAKLDSYTEKCVVPTGNGLYGQIQTSASALAEEMLFLKFVQGIPIVGVIGGISDTVFLHRIQKFAKLNYQYRILHDIVK